MFTVLILIFILSTFVTINHAEENKNNSLASCCKYPKPNPEYNNLSAKCNLINTTNPLTKTEFDHKVACSVKCSIADMGLLDEDGETINVANYRKIVYSSAADDDNVVDFYNRKMELCQEIHDEYIHILKENEECQLNNVSLLVCMIYETIFDCPTSMKTESIECKNHFRLLRVAMDSLKKRKVDVAPHLIVSSVLSMKNNLL